MTDLRALLAPIRERLSRAEDSAVTCQGDGLDKDYIHALETVSVDAARLLAAIEAVAELAEHPDVITRHPKGDKTFYVEAHRIRTALAAALGSDTTNQEGTQ